MLIIAALLECMYQHQWRRGSWKLAPRPKTVTILGVTFSIMICSTPCQPFWEEINPFKAENYSSSWKIENCTPASACSPMYIYFTQNISWQVQTKTHEKSDQFTILLFTICRKKRDTCSPIKSQRYPVRIAERFLREQGSLAVDCRQIEGVVFTKKRALNSFVILSSITSTMWVYSMEAQGKGGGGTDYNQQKKGSQ